MQDLEFDLFEVGRKLSNPLSIKQFMLNSCEVAEENSGYSRRLWDDLSVAGGFPGILMLVNLMELKGYLPQDTAHQYVLEIKNSLEREGIKNLSLFSGLSGLCFAIEDASRGKKRYVKMLNQLQSLLLLRVENELLNPILQHLKDGNPIPSNLYDVISGICGIGRYALENLSIEPFYKLTEKIVKTLILMTNPIRMHDHLVPGWYLSPADIINRSRFKDTESKGNFNTGLAHGMTGILAFLSIARLKGIEIEGQTEAIERTSTWLRDHAFSINGSTHWPSSVSWEEETEKKLKVPKMIKAGWCYGVPGIARALYLAGKALRDKELRLFAIQSMTETLNLDPSEWRLLGPGLCHGLAGLLAIANAMSLEEEGKELAPRVHQIKKFLLDQYNEISPWGFVDIDYVSETGRDRTVKVHKICYLEGAVGVYLTLFFLSECNSKWHLPLMIYE